jgi:hypothetical protein
MGWGVEKVKFLKPIITSKFTKIAKMSGNKIKNAFTHKG